MQAVIPLIAGAIVIEELASVLGITFIMALALYFGWTKPKNKKEEEAIVKARQKNDDDDGEEHLAWCSLSSYRGKTKTGNTNKGNTYYYEKDHTHTDIEVYKKHGSKGIHIGSVQLNGGKIYKYAVNGRTIDL